MQIKRLRIQNFKSFEDSKWIDLSPGFNVIVGKNSAGKTALLDAFRLHRNQPRPHLSAKRRKDQPRPDQSTFDCQLIFDKNELKDAALRGGAFDFPVSVTSNIPPQRQEAAIAAFHRFLENSGQSFEIRATANGRTVPTKYPSHGLFTPSPQQSYIQIIPNPDRNSFSYSDVAGGSSDSVINICDDLLTRKLYVFQAQRLNIGVSDFAESRILSDNASNLPQVLFALTTNPSRFERYGRHVNEIFPYIKSVTVFPKGHQLDVRLWWVDPSTERDDLAVPLQESGTGVGQALAILYVAMTIEKGVIVIDEPNSFLHPGAAKKLIEILSQYDHQYIISTHSPEIIAAANPNAIFATHWNDGDTSVERVEQLTAAKQRAILTEIGVSAIDVFGADKIIWVEGQTEEECFPIILQRAKGFIPPGLDFIAVRSVDEIARKQGTDAVVMELYNKLASESAIAPKLLRFSFDREKRSSEYITRTERDTHGKVRFLPARHYECFLLHKEAIASVLSSESVTFGKEPISCERITTWVVENAVERHSSQIASLDDAEWRHTTDAANLLKALFWDLAKIEFSKTKHSRALTEWLLDNDLQFINELTSYVVSLTNMKS